MVNISTQSDGMASSVLVLWKPQYLGDPDGVHR